MAARLLTDALRGAPSDDWGEGATADGGHERCEMAHVVYWRLYTSDAADDLFGGDIGGGRVSNKQIKYT